MKKKYIKRIEVLDHMFDIVVVNSVEKCFGQSNIQSRKCSLHPSVLIRTMGNCIVKSFME